ncbi:MAG: hypothetical protein L3V56_06505 [Candidatus Magnetoovum sp. WYHC-5]|nr:hypothetical protein [Candidatus Magnetoovum sp. WYHC-5]
MEKQQIDMKEIRALAQQFTKEEINECINQQLYEGVNECKIGPTDHVLNELSKAEYVSHSMEKGISLTEAMRDLAKRIRNVQQGFKET